MFFNKTVECEKCKHIVSKEKCQVVLVQTQALEYREHWLYYCPEHNVPYDRLKVDVWVPSRKYLREFEVNSDGTPIGYMKVPSAQEIVNELVKKGPGRPKGSKNKK